MSIASTTRRAGPYATNGVQTAFSFAFKVFDESDLRVVSSEDGLDTDLALDTNYTVVLNEDQDASPGGTVTLLTAPDGPKINILSDLPLEQPVVITNRGGFFPRVFNDVFDRLTIFAQQMSEKLDRALLAPLDTTAVIGQYPVVLPGGGYGFSSGTGSDPALRTDLGDGDNEVVAYDQRTVKSKLDDWKTPLDKGAPDDGLSDSTAYIDAVVAEGKHLVIPKGYKFKTRTKFGHRLITEGQLIENNGHIEYDGTQHAIGGGYTGFFALFSAVNVDGLQLVGGGKLSGGWDRNKTLVAGKVGSGIYLQNCHGALIDGPQLDGFFGECLKLFNCPENVVTRATRLYNSRNMGAEIKSYASNPLIGTLDALAGYLATAWTGTVAGPSGTFDAVVERIDDGQKGAQNGCGFDFSILAGAPVIPYYDIFGQFLDCLLAIWSENNVVGKEAEMIRIKSLIRGNIRGAADTECSDAIGMIGIKNLTIDADIKDQCNIAPPAGAETVGLNLISCSNVDATIRASFDAGITNKMQHIAKISGCTGVKLRGRQDGVTGISGQVADAATALGTTAAAIASPVLFNTDNVVGAQNFNVEVEMEGANAASTWTYHYGGSTADMAVPKGLIPLRYVKVDMTVSGAGNLLTAGGAGFDKNVLPSYGRLVGISARVNGSMAALNTFSVTVSPPAGGAVAQPLLTLTPADFNGGFSATKNADARLCPQLVEDSTVEVLYNVGAIPAGTDVEIMLLFDPSWKR